MSVPELAVLMPRTEAAHEGLLSADAGRVDLLLDPIAKLQLVADYCHDWTARGVRSGLHMYIALARAAGNEALAEKLERMEALMFPDGLRVVNLSYREESGRGTRLKSLLTTEVRQTLAKVVVDDRTLLEVTFDWIATAGRLGALENQRVAILTEGRNGDMARARALWVRINNLVRLTVESLEITEPKVLEVIDRFARVERVADRRAQKQVTSGNSDDTGAADADVDTDTDTDADADADAGVDTDADVAADAGVDTDADVAADAGAGVDTDAGVDADVDTEVDVDINQPSVDNIEM